VRAPRGYRLVTVAACAAAAAVTAALAGGPVALDGPLLDLAVAARAGVQGPPEPPARSPVAIVALDERSLEAPELTPYPRTLLAPVWAVTLDAILGGGARAVGFDILFSYSANRFAPDHDRPFLAALGRHHARIVLARSASTLPAPAFLAALRNDPGALGLAEVSADRDGAVRRVRAWHAGADGERIAGLAAAILARAGGPAMPEEVLLLPRRHPEALPVYALVDVLRCAGAPEALRAAFAGRVVLVGTSLPEEDRRVTSGRLLPAPRADGPPLHPCGLRRLAASSPDSAGVPGVTAHALALEAVLGGRVPALASPSLTTALAAAAAGGGGALALVLTPWAALAGVAALAALAAAAAVAALIAEVWLPVALPLGALAVAPGVGYVARYLAEERARRRVQHAFSHYLSPAIVERLARDPRALRLGGERREVTVMFADLSGFTALSGRVDPETLTTVTNEYLGEIVAEVEATGGYVDKFIGDAVMAIWNAPATEPAHAACAVRAALGAVRRVEAARLAAEGRGAPGYSVKIGLNSGPAVVGNVGAARRFAYTAVGETVNVAARLESVPGLYACEVVTGPVTAAQAADGFAWVEVDAIRVKGREAPLAIFVPLERDAVPAAAVAAYGAALARYRALAFAEAAAAWEDLAGAAPALAGPARTMAARARAYALKPPSEPWDGVFTLTGK
jgi:adenylate cyclase